MADDTEPRLINDVGDLQWFQNVLDESRQTLARTPETSQPSWYREYQAQQKNG